MKTFGILGANGSIGMRHARNLKTLGHDIIPYDPILANGVTRQQALDAKDGIIIASPTTEHYKDITDALDAGKPVFCEKPLSLNPHDQRQDEVAMVGYHLRFHPCVRAAKAWLTAGDIGQPMCANFTCAQYNEKYVEIGSGVIWNWSHEIDLAFHLLGPGRVANATANLTQKRVDFIADLSIRHDDRCLTHVHLDYVARPEIRQFIIIGSNGQIIVDLLSRNAWMRDDDGQPLEQFKGEGDYDDDYLSEIEAFVKGDYKLGCSGREGRLVAAQCATAVGKAGAVRL